MYFDKCRKCSLRSAYDRYIRIIACVVLVHFGPSIILPKSSHAAGIRFGSSGSKGNEVTGEGYASQSVSRSQKSELYKSYVKALRDPPTGLDHIDCHDDEVISEYCNFDPERIMELLIERASSQNTPPDKFYKEIKDLISLRIRASTESADKIKNEKWYKTLLELETKYNVKASGTDTDSITFSRLCFMFPHYSVAAKERSTNIILGHETQIFDDNKVIFDSDLVPIPGTFYPPEFAGLIPLGPIIKDPIREALIVVHLYVLHHQNSSVPLHTLQILVKRRIQSGLLSDEHRFRFLMNRGIITLQGTLTYETKCATFIIFENKDFVSNLYPNLTSYMKSK